MTSAIKNEKRRWAQLPEQGLDDGGSLTDHTSEWLRDYRANARANAAASA